MLNGYKRLLAFILDFLLIFMLTMAISSNYRFNPYLYDMEEATEEYEKLTLSIDEFNTEEKMNEFIEDASKKSYNLVKSQTFIYSWYLLFYILYFVIFVYFNNGQTLGKKLTRLRIVKKDGSKVGIKELLLRSITNGSTYFMGTTIYILALLIGLLLYKDNTNYFFIYNGIVSIISFIIELSNIIIFVTKSKELSLNDKIAKTKVITIK